MASREPLGQSFRLLWTANVLASLAGWSLGLVVSLEVVARTGSATVAAGLVIATTAPTALAGGVIGKFADRLDRRRLLRSTSLLRVPLVAALALGDHLIVMFAVVAVDALARQLVLACEQALLGDLFSGARAQLLPVATALNSTGTNVTRLVGPPGGGLLLSVVGFPVTVAVVVATLAAAAAVLLVLPPAPSTGRLPPPAPGRGPTNEHVRAVRLLYLVDGVKEGALTSLFAVFMVTVVGAGPALVGSTNAIFAVGALAAAPLIPRIVRRRGFRGPIYAGAVLSAAVLTPMVLFPSPATALGGFALAGVPFTVSWVAAGTLLLLRAPLDRRASTVAGANAVWSAAMLVSAGAAGVLGDLIGPAPVLLGALGVQALGGLGFALVCPREQLRDQRSPTASRSQKIRS